MSFLNAGSFLRDCNNTKMRHDRACLQIVTYKPITFWSQYEECEGCILLKTAELPATAETVVHTLTPLLFAFQNSTGQIICNGTYKFGEFGYYTLNLTQVLPDCVVRTTVEPVATYLPILTAVMLLLFMASFWYIVKAIGKRAKPDSLYARCIARFITPQNTNIAKESEISININTPQEGMNTATNKIEDNELGPETRVLSETRNATTKPKRSRLRSLDTFRGIAITLAIFVNAGGGGYDIFTHTSWNGITVANVVFPWFAFTMGEALVLSLNARFRTSMPKTTVFAQVACRSFLLACIGIMKGGQLCTWNDVRLPGVLQRLAAMYFIVGVLECMFMKINQDTHASQSYIRDITAAWPQWLATLLLVSIQVSITLLVAAPGCPRGYMGPGGLHLSALGKNLTHCSGGIAAYIDRLILGPDHVGFQSDPHGILGTLSGVLVVQTGAQATRVMLIYKHARERIIRLVLWSIVFGLAGGCLCMFSKNGGPIPTNEHLWSISHCLVCASTALFVQAVLHFIVDHKKWWGGRPLYYAGQNTLFLFVASRVLQDYFPLHWEIMAPTHSQLLATNVAATLFWLAVGFALHRKRVFITL